MGTQWSHKIDGLELNDYVAYACEVPEADNDFGSAVLLTDMQARTPVFNRQQPVEARFTFLVHIISSSDADYRVKRAALLAKLVPGVHTYAVTAPGENVARSISVYFDAGLTIDDEFGKCTARAVAPNPVFA